MIRSEKIIDSMEQIIEEGRNLNISSRVIAERLKELNMTMTKEELKMMRKERLREELMKRFEQIRDEVHIMSLRKQTNFRMPRRISKRSVLGE